MRAADQLLYLLGPEHDEGVGCAHRVKAQVKGLEELNSRISPDTGDPVIEVES